MAISDNTVLSQGLEALAGVLPPSWGLKTRREVAQRDRTLDALVKLTANDGKSAQVAVEVKQAIEPRQVQWLSAQLGGGEYAPLLIAPYLSPAVRERLREARMNFLDLTGNTLLLLETPALFIRTEGANVDPNPKTRSSRSLRGVKAGRIVRALIDSKQPPGVRELAERTGMDAGYVSRIVSLLDREALIVRSNERRIERVDWQRLLRRWAEEAPLSSRGVQTSLLEARGIDELKTKLAAAKLQYALSGTLAAASYAPVAPPRLALLYATDALRAQRELGLRPTDTGANVFLIEPSDETLAEASSQRDGLRLVSPSQAAADLLTSPGRGPAEAEELISWMAANEGAWRG
jgi:hypothetical protein